MQTSIPADLPEKLRLILSQSDPRAAMYRGLPGSEAIDTTGVVEQPGLFELDSEQLDMIRRLHATLPATAQPFLVPAMLTLLDQTNGPLVAHAIVELREIAAIRDLDRLDTAAAALLRGITVKLGMEHWKFRDEDIADIELWMSRLSERLREQREPTQSSEADRNVGGGFAPRTMTPAEYLEQLLRRLSGTLQRVKYLRLRHELLSLGNPILDTDRRELLSRLDALSFSPSLMTALDEIERRSLAATTSFDFKSAMDLLRTFYEEFIEESACKASVGNQVVLPTGARLSHFAPYKDYLRNVGVIAREEDELLQKLYNYLSNMGSHVLGSAPEQFHVCKTTVIEWCLLIAGRLRLLHTTP